MSGHFLMSEASSEDGEEHLDSPHALLSHQVELEALLEAGLELDFHSPEYAKFRMEGQEISPKCNLDSRATSDSDGIFDISGWVTEDDVELEAIMEAAEAELQKATQILQSRARAKLLDDEETQALMQEWSVKGKSFDAPLPSPDRCVAVVAPPPLANGLGPVLHMRNGGSLRSMSPSHFHGDGRGASAAKLVMQVSSPVVVPSEMGATSMAILRRMAMAGVEAMGAQAATAMPLEDITGKAADQLSIEHRDAQSLGSGRTYGCAALEYGESNAVTPRENGFGCRDGSRTTRNGVGANSPNDGFMGLEELAPMAMAKIEALALEGLLIQAEMAEQAPCVVEPMAASEPSFTRLGHRAGKLNGLAGPLLESGTPDENVMAMAVSLDEWMRLDAGVCGEHETEALAIISAHSGVHSSVHKREMSVYGTQSDRNNKHRDRNNNRSDARSNASQGYMGDTITLALLVQLRDPLRNHEPVGAPMMALVQAERAAVPPKPKLKLGRRITSLPGRRDEKDEDEAQAPPPPRFKIVGVTVAGLKTSPTKEKKVWGNQRQVQAGSRWLVAQGMQKSVKSHPALKGKAPAPSAPAAPQVKVQRGDSLWSISARVHGSGAKWRDIAKLNPHIRNPDVIFPDTSIRTH